MIQRKIFYILCLLGFVQTSLGQHKAKFHTEIATWMHDKQGAVSVSFDDASYTQYTYAYPTLKKFGMHATFSLVGTWTHDKATYSAEPGYFNIKKMGWQEILTLHQDGNEIAAHGYNHSRYGKRLALDTLVKQMRKIKELIEKKINAPVYTLHYPYSFTSKKIELAAKNAHFLFGRTDGANINSSSPANNFLLVSKAIINDSTPNINIFKQWLHQADGKWLILMYHHLFPGNSKEMKILNHHKVINTYSLLPDTFEKQMKTLSKTNLWVAPISEVGRYIKERNQTKIITHKICKTYKIKTVTDLDKNIYQIPLTLKVKLPWKKVKIKGSKNDGIYPVKNGELLIDVVPGNTIIIKKK